MARPNLVIDEQVYRSGIIDPLCTLFVSISKTNPTTIGGSDGQVTADDLSGQGAITYLWTTVDGSIPAGEEIKKTATGLTKGTYKVVVTDDITTTCTATDTAILADPPSLPACLISIDSIAVVAPSLFGLSDGTATATVSGNSGAIGFLWDDDQTTNPAVGLPSGAISLAVSDTAILGCIDIEVAIIPIGAAFIFKTTSGVPITLTMINGASNLLTWTSVSATDGTIVETGDTVTLNHATVEEHVVTVKCANPSLITGFDVTTWESKSITEATFSVLDSLTGEVDFRSNSMIVFIPPPLSNTITKWVLSDNDIAVFDWDNCQQCEELSIFGNNNLTSLGLTGITAPLKALQAQNSALPGVDLSSFSDTSSNCSILVQQPSTTQTITTFISPFTATGKMDNIVISDTIIVVLNLANTTKWTSSANITGEDMDELTTINFPTATEGKILILFENCPKLTGADLSGIFDFITRVRFVGNALFTSIIFPVITLTARVDMKLGNNALTTVIDFSNLTDLQAHNNHQIDVFNNNKPVAVVNEELDNADSAISGESPTGDFTGRNFNTIGTNAAPNDGSGAGGGIDGLQAVINLVARAYSVNTN